MLTLLEISVDLQIFSDVSTYDHLGILYFVWKNDTRISSPQKLWIPGKSVVYWWGVGRRDSPNYRILKNTMRELFFQHQFLHVLLGVETIQHSYFFIIT